MDSSLRFLWCLASLVAVSRINGQNPNDSASDASPVSLVRNLGVYPGTWDVRSRQLQLYINWTVPEPKERPYQLRVKSVNETDEYCEIMDYTESIDDMTRSWVVVPPVITTVNGDPRVLPECSYSVRVEPHPYDGKHAAEVTYTVPEHVGDLWSCRNESQLPVPTHLRVSVVNSSAVDVTWSLDAEAGRLATNFSVMLARRLGGPGDFYYYERKLEVARDQKSLRQAVRVLHDLAPSVWFKAEVRLIDHRGCHGPPAEAKFRAIDPSGWSRVELLLLVIVPVVAVTLAAVLALLVLCHRRGWLGSARERDPRNRRGIYKAVGSVVRHPATEPWPAGRTVFDSSKTDGSDQRQVPV